MVIYDDCCIISRNVDGQITGFVTVKLKGNEAQIVLIGVPKNHSGRGWVKKLLSLAKVYGAYN